MRRWIIVSNRLPFSYDAKKNKLKQSSGGLVTAIRGINSKEPIVWVGSLPDNVPRSLVKSTKDKSKSVNYSFPEFSPELYESYYNDFCNDVLWPILHYEFNLVKFREEAWENYITVNKIFAEHILEIAQPGDQIWIHDFHLFLTPQYIKEKNPDLNIGFFLHVPFPSSEIYKQLPCRAEILKALLHADLVGFHDFSFLRHFTSSVYTILGVQCGLLDVDSPYNHTKLGIFPVSINTPNFIKRANAKKTQNEIERYGLDTGRRTYILGVDRLDYSKGVLLKLRAFKKFLEDHPKYIGKVQLIQIAVPSRTDVAEYINLRHKVERLVSEINGRYSRIDYIPVKYIFNSVSMHELMALYRTAKVLLVTSKRDGMNLVCLEYIATQEERDPGVVVISEFAGAASTLSHALIINPMNIKATVEKLAQAISMPKKERIRRHKPMLQYLTNYTATTWAESFMYNLAQDKVDQNQNAIKISKRDDISDLVVRFKEGPNVLLLDYDGTLSPIINNPSKATITPKILKLLKKIQDQEKNEIVIVSGRPADFLQKQFKEMECYLACEHGARFFDYKNKKWRKLVSSGSRSWYTDALLIMKDYTRRTPNSMIEKKKHAVAWHYRNSPNEFGNFQAKKMVFELERALSHLPVSVISGKKVVEIKAIEANKGYFGEWFIERYVSENSQIFAIGDDRTDEDLFQAIGDRGLTVKVGNVPNTNAQYYIQGQGDVYTLLRKIFA